MKKMLKHLLAAMVVLLPIISVCADNLSINPFALKPGDSHIVTVNMSNAQIYTAFQIDIILPENMEFQQQNGEYIALSEGVTDNHFIRSNLVDVNKIKVICYSNNNTPLSNNNDRLFSFFIKANGDFKGGEISLSNIIFSDAFNKETIFSKVNTFISKITPVERLSLSHSTVELKASESIQLSASVYPETSTDKTVVWIVDDPSVATVDAEGKVTAVSVGTATVTARAAGGSNVEAQCLISVVTASSVNCIRANEKVNNVIYSVFGKRLFCEFKDLPSGIYIVNGRKVVKK